MNQAGLVPAGGSKVIVITENKEILRQYGINHTYAMWVFHLEKKL